MYKMRLLRNTKRNLQFFSIYFHSIEMFINKNVKYWKNTIPVFTELPCDGGDSDEGQGDEMDCRNKDVGIDNINAGYGENKVDLGDMYNGGGDSSDDTGVDDVGRANTIGGDDADFGNGDTKFHFVDDRGGGDGDDEDEGGDDDGVADSSIGNDANCGDGRSKVDCSKDTTVDDGNGKSYGGGDANEDGKGGDDNDDESNDGADGHKNDGDDDDDGCLNSIKNCLKNKKKVLENFSLPDSARWRKYL